MLVLLGLEIDNAERSTHRMRGLVRRKVVIGPRRFGSRPVRGADSARPAMTSEREASDWGEFGAECVDRPGLSCRSLGACVPIIAARVVSRRHNAAAGKFAQPARRIEPRSFTTFSPAFDVVRRRAALPGHGRRGHRSAFVGHLSLSALGGHIGAVIGAGQLVVVGFPQR